MIRSFNTSFPGKLEMRALICGGRKFGRVFNPFSKEQMEKAALETREFNRLMNIEHARKEITCVIQGGAYGADRLAVRWAQGLAIPIIQFNADWDKYGKAAGSIRNTQMLREGKPDWCFAFPGGPGTANMIKQARNELIGVTVFIL